MKGYDINLLKAGSLLNLTFAHKANDLSACQPNTTVEGEKAIQTATVEVDFVEDRGEYLYFGYHPIGKDRRLCKFGAARAYRAGRKEFGVVGIEAVKDQTVKGETAMMTASDKAVFGAKRIMPEEGVVYTNRDGHRYLCTAAPDPDGADQGAVMERVMDGWTLKAHNVYQFPGGTIGWDFSTCCHWAV